MEKEKINELLEKIKESKPTGLFDKCDQSEVGSLKVLSLLSENGELTAGDLSKSMNVSTARIAVLIKKMESDGTIITKQDEKDKRKTIISISEKGSNQLNKWKDDFYSLLSSIFDEVGEEKIAQFIAISIEIKQILEKKIRGYLC